MSMFLDFLFAFLGWFASPIATPVSRIRRVHPARLGIEPLEDRYPPAADLSVVWRLPQDLVELGQASRQVVVVRNHGDQRAEAVSLRVQRPLGRAVVRGIGDLRPGESRTVSLSIRDVGMYRASATSVSPESNLRNNVRRRVVSLAQKPIVTSAAQPVVTHVIPHSVVTTEPTPGGNTGGEPPAPPVDPLPLPTVADVALAFSGPGTVSTGATAVYLPVLRQNGPDDAEDVLVTVTVPNRFEFTTIGSSSLWTLNGTKVTANVDRLRFNEMIALPLAFRVMAPPGSVYLNASVSSDNDPNGNNDSLFVFTTVFSPPSPTVIDMSATATLPATVEVGQSLTLTLSTANRGTATAENVTIEMALLPRSTLVSVFGPVTGPAQITGQRLSLPIGNFRPGETKILSLTFSVPTLPVGTLAVMSGLIVADGDATEANDLFSASTRIVAETMS